MNARYKYIYQMLNRFINLQENHKIKEKQNTSFNFNIIHV